MALVNHSKREINAKIVYYGPERTGKATSLRYVYDRIKPTLRGILKTVPVSGSSMLFFDFSPFEHAVFGDYRIRLHIYTLQGLVANPAAWKMTLKGLDGLVFVADASLEQASAAQQSLTWLRGVLSGYGVGLDDIPVVLQLNKADQAGQVVTEDLARELGLSGRPALPTSALSGAGVLETLTCLSRLVMGRIGERDDLPRETVVAGAATAESPVPLTPSSDQPLGLDFHETAEQLEAIAEIPFSNDLDLRVAVADSGLAIDGGTVRIPLEVVTPGGVQRLVVTILIAPG